MAKHMKSVHVKDPKKDNFVGSFDMRKMFLEQRVDFHRATLVHRDASKYHRAKNKQTMPEDE